MEVTRQLSILAKNIFMDNLNTFANTTYGDFKGKISIDFHGISQDLFSLGSDKGIDTNKHFPFAFSFYDESISGIGSNGMDDISLTIFTLATDEYGQTFEEIAKTLKANGGVANAQRHKVTLNRSDISKYFKRLSLMVVSDLRDHISEIK